MSISPELRVTYQREDEFMGKLHGTLQLGSFAGQGSAWFDQTNIKQKFLTELKKFPLLQADFPKLEGGILEQKSKRNLGSMSFSYFYSAG